MQTGVLAQVDEMVENEERDRICWSLNKELASIDDDIRFILADHFSMK
jgi:hypothetical protein